MNKYFYLVWKKTKSNNTVEKHLVPLPGQKDDTGLEMDCNLKVKRNESQKMRINGYAVHTVFSCKSAVMVSNMFTTDTLVPLDMNDPSQADGYRTYRNDIETKTGVPFDDYVKSQIVEEEEPQQDAAQKPASGNIFFSLLHDKRYSAPTIEDDGFVVDKKMWAILLHNIMKQQPTLITGPSGCGKTQVIEVACRKLGLNLTWFDMGVVTDPERTLLGTHVIDQDKKSAFAEAAFAKAITQPGVILLDEFNRAPDSCRNLLFPLLDHRRTLNMEQAFGCSERERKMHPQCSIVATANVSGSNGNFSGTYDMDAALLNRMAQLEMGYLDETTEIHLIETRCGVRTSDARNLVNIARRIRENYARNALSVNVSTRETLAFSQYVADGLPLKDTLTYLLLPMYDADERKVVNDMIYAL